MIFLKLFWGFLKVGLFSFGGGYGAVALIRDVVLHYGWMDDEKISYMIAVSESTPGPIMVNFATYVGSTQAGVLGAITATVAVVIPSFFIVILILSLLKKASENRVTGAAIMGIKPCIMGIILATGVYMIFSNCAGDIADMNIDFTNVSMTIVLSLIYFASGKVFKKRLSPISLIVISAAAGILVTT